MNVLTCDVCDNIITKARDGDLTLENDKSTYIKVWRPDRKKDNDVIVICKECRKNDPCITALVVTQLVTEFLEDDMEWEGRR